MKLVVYTIPYEVKNEVKKINYFFENGLDKLHLRKPGYSKKEYIKILEGINPEFYSKIVLHDHYLLARKFPIGGIHIPVRSADSFLMKALVKYLKSKNKNLQISGTIETPILAENAPEIIDETYLGPIFMRYSEENLRLRYDQFELKRAVTNSAKKIVALGGITLDKLSLIEQIGFDGVALQSSIWKSEDIYNAFQAFKLSIDSVESNTTLRKVAIG